MKAAITIVKRQLAGNRISFIITALVVLLSTTSSDSVISLSNGNYTWLLAVMAPFFLVFSDYTKLKHLGAGKKDYYTGSLLCYGFLSFFISIVNSGIHFLIDPLNKSQTVINLMDLCGFTKNGFFTAVLQQAMFLFLTMIFLHVLLSMQPYWYGWVTDGILTFIICIFTPITFLRHLLVSFFKIIMFNDNALLHIAACITLSTLLALAGLAVLKQKTS